MSEQANSQVTELRNSYLAQLQESNGAIRQLEAQLEQIRVRRLQLQGAIAGLDELSAVVAKAKADAAAAEAAKAKQETKAEEAKTEEVKQETKAEEAKEATDVEAKSEAAST